MKNLYPKTCKSCSVTFQGGPRAWYCPSCREKRRKEQGRKCKLQGAQRPLGSTDKCTVCGEEYIVESGQQKYCKDCALGQYKETDRKQGLEYYGKNRETINPVRKLSRRKTGIACSECGTVFGANGKRGETCSPECKRKRRNRLWMERYYKNKP